MKKITDIPLYFCKFEKDEIVISAESQHLVNALFVILQQHVTFFRVNRMRLQDEMQLAKREWAKTFIANKLSKDEILAGIEIVRTSKTKIDDLTPIEFIVLCRPKTPPKCHQLYIEHTPENITPRDVAISHLAKIREMLR